MTVLQKFKNGFPKDLSDVTREIFGPTQRYVQTYFMLYIITHVSKEGI